MKLSWGVFSSFWKKFCMTISNKSTSGSRAYFRFILFHSIKKHRSSQFWPAMISEAREQFLTKNVGFRVKFQIWGHLKWRSLRKLFKKRQSWGHQRSLKVKNAWKEVKKGNFDFSRNYCDFYRKPIIL